MMNKLMAQLKEAARNRRITNTMIAQKLGVSNTSVGNYFKGKDQISFCNYLLLLNMIYGDDVSDKEFNAKLLEFAISNKRKDNDRIMMEWFSHRGENELLQVVANRASKDDYQALLGQIYDLLLKRRYKKVTGEEFYYQTEDLKSQYRINHVEERIMLMMCTLYANWELGCFKVINALSKRILTSIEDLGDPFLEKAYRIRTLEMLMYSALKRNAVEEVVEFGECIIRESDPIHFPFVINSAYITMAEAHSLTDYKTSLHYINESLKINQVMLQRNKMRKDGLESTHDYIKITNNDFEGLYLSDASERAHYLAKIGKSKEAVQILDEIERNKELSPHQTFYKAIALNDERLFQKSLSQFINEGDLFYAQRPIHYLYKGKYN